ncbi:VOC family protein [Neobacillus sp. NPDC093127]|uniref:VOC family protein n=1 Tax=Neobacillus sp. NPDC093127 TaxID=3364296 RepID=UPI0038067AB9
MQFSFDHLVCFLKKPEEAIPLLKQRGIHAANGGRHDSWGTYNSLTYFGLSYIEFLGIENQSIAEKQEENRLITQIVEQLSKRNREGPARIAIRTDDIEQLAVKLRAEGYTVYGPLPGERMRADGQVIRWSLLFPENRDNELTLPFFIQWEKPDKQRVLDLEEQGFIDSHTTGNPKFESVGFVVHNLEEAIKRWGNLFNLKQSEEFVDLTINARCKKLELPGVPLLFCTPIGEGLAAKILKEKGETPFLINLTGTDQNPLIEMLNGLWRFQ